MKHTADERLFQHFIDAVDGVVCVPAKTDAAGLAARCAPEGWRFPLLCDAAASLGEQVAAASFTPASSRFGAYCDNITGMNWEQPGGGLVRVGEIVVKSTTGYDLVRFLSNSDGRLGRANDFVLRLRPLCDGGGLIFFEGKPGALAAAADEVCHSDFLHWIDSFDILVGGEEVILRAGVHCPAREWPIFLEFFREVARRHALRIDEHPGDGAVYDGLPDLCLKTTPDRVFPLAAELGDSPGRRTVGLLSSGVVNIFFSRGEDLAARISAILAPVAESLYAEGGDWHSRHIGRPTSTEEEEWLRILVREGGFFG